MKLASGKSLVKPGNIVLGIVFQYLVVNLYRRIVVSDHRQADTLVVRGRRVVGVKLKGVIIRLYRFIIRADRLVTKGHLEPGLNVGIVEF